MSKASATAVYQPSDQLHLWWLAQPDDPVYIGQLNTVRTLRGVSLRYDAGWLARGSALSEDLPLIDHEFLPRDKDTAPGVSAVVAGWRRHFTDCGVGARDIALLAEQIDRPFLREQRDGFAIFPSPSGSG